MNPLSSRNTTLAFCSRPFFYARPSLLLPSLNRRLVSLAGTLLRLLHTPAQIVQQRADVVDVIRHTEQLFDYRSYPGAGPKVVWVAIGSRTPQQRADQP